MKALRLPLLALAALAACSPPPTGEPVLGISVRPNTIKDTGEEADVRVFAQDENGKPGRGPVHIVAERGQFANGATAIDVELDSSGQAFTTWACSVYVDDACDGIVSMNAQWNYTFATTKSSVELDAGTRATIIGCGPIDAGNPVIRRTCAPATDNECDGTLDTFLSGAGVGALPDGGTMLNGLGGNGFDDDCDGLADEGCACPSAGLTRDCFLVPATQVDPVTKAPVNWCADNAKGTVDCAGETSLSWTGICRGAQPPALHDTCSKGDLNCDGLEGNNDLQGCRCAVDVECPTAPITLQPYPDPAALPPIDGTQWITDPAVRTTIRTWKWTVVGGDCDNVLPWPTFAIYNGPNSTTAARLGNRVGVVYDNTTNPSQFRVVPASKLAALRVENAQGIIYPAFGLSGDYTVQGEFEYQGERFACLQKVQVRAPGVRAELCWDNVGSADIDLHFARLQGVTCSTQGWDDTCGSTGRQDCFWENTRPDWGYAVSPDAMCKGWSSKQTGTCNNPRLDKDNISCTRTAADPLSSAFCGPENINVDNPNDGDRFAVGVTFYGGQGPSLPHVNLYCNGARVLSTGYNPVTQQRFPALLTAGGDISGDYWTVATIEARVDGGALEDCIVETIPSRSADPTRDGPPQADAGATVCVDSTMNASPVPYSYTSHAFIEAGSAAAQNGTAGGVPATRVDWCKH